MLEVLVPEVALEGLVEQGPHLAELVAGQPGGVCDAHARHFSSQSVYQVRKSGLSGMQVPKSWSRHQT